MTPPRRFTVAIDGPAAAGKGTVSRAVAAELGLAHLDTGLLYRATARRTMEGGDPVEAARALTPGDLDAPDLRTAEVARMASQIAAIPLVRAALLEFQRGFARRPGGAVLDGRDIGTVVCPEADVKLYVTAADTVRATRRHAELASTGVSAETVLAQVRDRDARDAGRKDAPMRAAEGATVIDTSDMDIDTAVAAALAVVRAAWAG